VELGVAAPLSGASSIGFVMVIPDMQQSVGAEKADAAKIRQSIQRRAGSTRFTLRA